MGQDLKTQCEDLFFISPDMTHSLVDFCILARKNKVR